ncbi:MAG: Rv3235 family protein [Varibaculum cambriense]|uniref:Rv3235 family protein n=1 Tax=Varibaculum cambriense TaxID=184870 RepID=UPI0029125396|nr:Rv3235 family protein [Varibaculum cambriense]MDU6681439.1 Rv3235 family protein [Varibaculum cambriense]MDU7407710.1 Rv3235 family protein [Varibaculum cambriense]
MSLAAQSLLPQEVTETDVVPEIDKVNRGQELFPPGKPLVTICPQDGDTPGPCAIICPELPRIPLSPRYGRLEVQTLLPRPQASKNPSTKPAGTPLSSLPQIKPWVATAVKTIFEVFSGRRSAQAVTNWFTPDLKRPFLALARSERHRPLPTAIQIRRMLCRKVGIGTEGGGAFEVAVSISDGSRVRAVAMRIIPCGKKWKISALEIG